LLPPLLLTLNLKNLDLHKILTEAKPIIEKAGRYIQEMSLKKAQLNIEEKFKNNLVSEVDRIAEEILVEGLNVVLPEAGFYTEEETTKRSEEPLKWVIDPLDGTTNFLRGVPAYCVSVALVDGDTILIGLVYDCVLSTFYTAVKDGGAFQNEQKLQVNNHSFEKALFATGFPFYNYDKAEAYLEIFKYVMYNSMGMRRLGSAALDLCHVANGTYDGYFEWSLQPYDVAAGALIVKEAGGLISDFSGGNDFMAKSEMLAASPVVFERLLAQIKKSFG